jgi:hypothetical protein
MVNSSRIKKNRLGHKGQSLVEVAVFGSLLLMVLGLLLSSGLEYNYKQEVKMEAFRRAMQMASASNVPKTHTVQEIKDVHFPDPSDIFALGSRGSIQGVSEIFWSNNSTPLDYSTDETRPLKRYVFNPSSPLVGIQNRTYTTAALEPEPGSIIPGNNSILNGIPDTFVVGDLSQTKVFQAQEGYGTKDVMVLMNTPANCPNVYCEKDILGQVEYTSPRGGKQYYPVFNVTDGEVGDPPNTIAFLNRDAGQINSTLERQQVVNKTIVKDSSLRLVEDANTYTSTDTLNNKETLEHVIISIGGPAGPTFEFGDAKPTTTWTTAKPN